MGPAGGDIVHSVFLLDQEMQGQEARVEYARRLSLKQTTNSLTMPKKISGSRQEVTMRRLPPLNALRAFESGARHCNFTRAAEELHLTQAAVSHSVKALEEYLGVLLFRRLPRKVVLTDEGQLLLPIIAETFDRLGRSLDELRSAHTKIRTLTVSVTPSFGGRWLAPRLSTFWKRYPDIDLRLHHSNHPVDFAADGVDLAVRWGHGTWPGLESEYLMRSSLIPVCSPVLAKAQRLTKPAQLRAAVLLHEYNYQAWTQWLLAARVDGIDVRSGPVYDDRNVLEQAVLAGKGVALMREASVRDGLARGLLVKPFRVNIELAFAYYIVYPPAAINQPKVRMFRDFLLAEAAAESGAPKDRVGSK
jgi:LysR family glycine cleavage system transcriptional activator